MKYTRQQLERMPIEILDRAAFGFQDGSILNLEPDQIKILYDGDYHNVEEEIEDSDLGPERWARKIRLSEPVEVTLRNGVFWLEDGHHRYLAAKILGKKLKCLVDIRDKPVEKILDLQERGEVFSF